MGWKQSLLQSKHTSLIPPLGTILRVTWWWNTFRILVSIGSARVKPSTADEEKAFLVGGDSTPPKAGWILEQFSSLH